MICGQRIEGSVDLPLCNIFAIIQSSLSYKNYSGDTNEINVDYLMLNIDLNTLEKKSSLSSRVLDVMTLVEYPYEYGVVTLLGRPRFA